MNYNYFKYVIHFPCNIDKHGTIKEFFIENLLNEERNLQWKHSDTNQIIILFKYTFQYFYVTKNSSRITLCNRKLL